MSRVNSGVSIVESQGPRNVNRGCRTCSRSFLGPRLLADIRHCLRGSRLDVEAATHWGSPAALRVRSSPRRRRGPSPRESASKISWMLLGESLAIESGRIPIRNLNALGALPCCAKLPPLRTLAAQGTGQSNNVEPCASTKLTQDARYVVLDCLNFEVQPQRDFLVCHSVC